jgi:hypothetical protein
MTPAVAPPTIPAQAPHPHATKQGEKNARTEETPIQRTTTMMIPMVRKQVQQQQIIIAMETQQIEQCFLVELFHSFASKKRICIHLEE